jgi:hypothetical protein
MAHRHLTGYVHDIEGGIHTIEIYRMGYFDSEYIIPYSSPDTPKLTHKGGDKDNWDEEIIQGVEMTYEFFVPNTDTAIIDLLMESEYGVYYLIHSIQRVGQPVPNENYRGLLKPENMSCDFRTDPAYIKISVSATDAMADLKQLEFKDNGVKITGRKSLLEVLKLAVASRSIIHTGGIFYIILNTIEVNLMTLGDCPLEKIYVNCERFFKDADKGTEYMTC